MAGIGYSAEQIQELITSVKTVEACINGRVSKVEELFKLLTSDQVMSDSEYRDTVAETYKKFRAGVEEINKVLDAANKYIEEVAGAVNISVSNTIISIQEQEALIAKALAEAGSSGDR